MNIETQLFAVLGPLVGGRAFPEVAPEGTALPYITFQNVGGQPLSYADGSAPDKEFSRMQVNVWAATRIEASDLGKVVELAMRAVASFQTDVLTGRPATNDETTGYRGTRQDFRIFA